MTGKNVKVKILELISVLGVGTIGFGLGAFFSYYIKTYALPVILIGVLTHGLAMYKVHARNKKESLLVKFLYWVCWIIIIGLAIYVLLKLII